MLIISGLQICRKLSIAASLVLGGVVIATSGNCAWGQIASDNTLGSESSQITSPIPGNFQIDGGATRGTNLFHSFSQFSVPTKGTAHFNNASNIQNIISRVTGGSVSNIDGLIKANDSANLFLINPAGIIFGPNAKLNIGGSFIASTADSLLFKDGIKFSATDTQTQPLLTINVPLGLQLGENPVSVKVQGSLEVKSNQNLALVGGDISLEKGKLTAPGGRIELGGLSVAGEVGRNENGSLNFPNNVARADVSLTNGSSVDVRAGGGGFITINARNLKVGGGKRSQLLAGIKENLGTLDAQAGDVEINASDTVSFDGNNEGKNDGNLENLVEKNAKGNAGKIKITTGSLFLSDDALLSTQIGGKGNAGDVIIHASAQVSLENSEIETEIDEEMVEGKAGNIEITTKSLSLVKNSQLQANTDGKGPAGKVIISASDRISIEKSQVLSQVEGKDARGNSGGIYMNTGSLFLSNGTLLSSESQGKGNAGNVIINASDTVSLDKSKIETEIENEKNKNVEGKAGNIEITTKSLSLNQSTLEANTEGKGDAGNVIIHASNDVSIHGPGTFRWNEGEIETKVEGEKAEGNAGNIDITTKSLFLDNAAILRANTGGTGNAGKVSISVSDRISLDHTSQILSQVESTGQGNSGGIEIKTGSLSLSNGANISAQNLGGTGNAGNIRIHASDSISLKGKDSEIQAETEQREVQGEVKGNAGNIKITTKFLDISDSASLEADTEGIGDAGNIIINASDTVSLNKGEIETRVDTKAKGKGGNIEINTKFLSLVDNPVGDDGNPLVKDPSLAAETRGEGDAGKIIINATDSISLNGSRVSSRVDKDAKGNAGGIYITTTSLSLTNKAELNVSSFGSGSPSDLNIKADTIRLDNEAQLTAKTASGNGGNINLQLQDLLLLHHRSTISTDAGTEHSGGNGGNITINALDGFIVAVPSENSDITANAYSGQGGKVTINAYRIFGMVPRSRQDLERLRPNDLDPKEIPTNDITAISQQNPSLSGTVTLNTPNIDPSQGLVQLPVEPVNVEVAQGCQAGGKQSSAAFVNKGRGGIAPNPYEPLSSNNIWEDVPSSSTSASLATAPDKIVEAKGWIVNEKGEVALVAEVPTTTSQLRCHLD